MRSSMKPAGILIIIISWVLGAGMILNPGDGPVCAGMPGDAGTADLESLQMRYAEKLAEMERRLDELLQMDELSRSIILRDYFEVRETIRELETCRAPDAVKTPVNSMENAVNRPYHAGSLEWLRTAAAGAGAETMQDYSMAMGNVLCRRMDYATAAECFLAGTASHLYRRHATHLAARAFRQAGNPAAAKKQYSSLIHETDYTLHESAMLEYCDLVIETGEPGTAREILNNLPWSEQRGVLTVQAAVAMGDWPAAAAANKRLRIENPAGRFLPERDRLETDIQAHMGTAALNLTASERYNRARNLDSAGWRSAAAAEYRAVIFAGTDERQDALSRLYLAKILSDTRENEAALGEYDEFIQKYPSHSSVPTVLMRKGIICRRLNRDEAYLAVTGDIISRHTGSQRWQPVLISRGEYWRSLGDLDAAKRDFHRAAARKGAYRTMAMWKEAWVDYDRAKFSAAMTMFRRIARENRNSTWEPQCQFWEAVCLEKLGDGKSAAGIFDMLASKYPMQYSGHRAMERLGIPEPDRLSRVRGNLTSAVPEEPEVPAELLQRSRKLEKMGFHRRAVEEWNAVYRAAHRNEAGAYLYAAALSRAGRNGDARRILHPRCQEYLRDGTVPRQYIPILYPLPEQTWGIIRDTAEKERIDPYLAASLILQESGFDPAALSHNLAAGYMQLMPDLFARMMADLNSPAAENDRFNPAMNIAAGIHYLRSLLDRYDGDAVKALAAYNAGEHRVDEWQVQFADMNEAEWVEHIPFTQTRLFVKRILENRWCYHAFYLPANPRNDEGNPPAGG